MSRSHTWCFAVLAVLAAPWPAYGEAPSSKTTAVPIRKCLVRIQTVSQDPNYTAPWNGGQVVQGVGAGFVISGERIMTNAHVISNARFITVSKEGDPTPYPARRLQVAHDCDLALLTVDAPGFFQGTQPAVFDGIPAIESTVMVYGYPIGGERMSVTRGIVSRIDFQDYSHSGADQHLAVQIDAAINPGNSGGPVVQDGKVVGVAFQGYSGDVAQNTGYMIPTPVMERFLKDVQDGTYDHYMDLAITYQPLFNPAARKALKLPDDNLGVLVSTSYGGGSADGILKPGDVLMAIDGHPVASDGTVQMDGSEVELAEVVERKFRGDNVELDVLRDGQRSRIKVPLAAFPFDILANQYDVTPRYYLFGGLLFQPVDRNFAGANRIDNQRTQYFFDHFLTDHIYREHPEIIVLSNVLSDPVNAYAGDFRQSVVDTVNGAKIRTLEDLARAFETPSDYYVIEFVGGTRPVVLEAKAVAQAEPRILERYKVSKKSNLER